MDTTDLLRRGREIWGDEKLSLDEVSVRLQVVVGDIARYARDRAEGRAVDAAELKKEMGNIIFSTIRWCDDVGLKPEECIELAMKAQHTYRQRLKGKV